MPRPEQVLQESAKRLLASTGVLDTLSRFGTVRCIGSFAFELMTEPDIDLIVVTDDPERSSEEALVAVARLHLFQKIEYGDFEKFPREHRPPFYILAMRTSWEGEMFEIETWFMPDAGKEIAFAERMRNLSEKERREILELKLRRKRDGVGKKQLSSFQIYQQVLGPERGR